MFLVSVVPIKCLRCLWLSVVPLVSVVSLVFVVPLASLVSVVPLETLIPLGGLPVLT